MHAVKGLIFAGTGNDIPLSESLMKLIITRLKQKKAPAARKTSPKKPTTREPENDAQS